MNHHLALATLPLSDIKDQDTVQAQTKDIHFPFRTFRCEKILADMNDNGNYGVDKIFTQQAFHP